MPAPLPPSRRPAPLTALLFAVAVGLAATVRASAAAPTPPALQREVDAMVAELLARDAAKVKLRAAGQRVAFDGVAWEIEPGTAAGTSPLGLQINDAVAAALERRRIAPGSTPGVATRGIGGAILKGAFSSVGSAVGVALSLVDANSGRIVSEVRRRLDPSSLADLGVKELLPPNAPDARLLGRLVQGALGAGPQAFRLQVRTLRGANAAYFEGDHLQVEVEAERDCHLRLYHVSWTEKRLTMIFPNRSERDSRIPGGRPVRVPADGSAAVFQVARPYGVDAIVAIGSEQPFEDEERVMARLAAEAEPGAPPAEAPEPAEAIAPPSAEPAPATGDPGAAPETAEPASSPADLGGMAPAGEFLSEPDVDEARTRGVLTRGLVVLHRPALAGGAGDPGAAAAGLAAGPGTASTPVARAVCFFTTLPRLSLSKP